MESWGLVYTADEILIEGPSPPSPLVQRNRLGLSQGHLDGASSDPKGFTSLLER